MAVKYKDNTGKYMANVKANMRTAATDIKNDLVNSARSTAPHKTGQLEKGITGKLKMNDMGFKIDVGAQARGNNGYNYATKMHDGGYVLGKRSMAKGSGTSGMSGKSYPVGKGYLLKPLEGNYKSYLEHLQKALKNSKV